MAIYRFGCEDASHPAVLFIPGPHRFGNPGESNAQALIRGFVELGNQVISFDPPGSGFSTSPCNLSMQEMHDCANEAWNVVIGRSVKVVGVGHSMGGMALLAYALDYPSCTERLILIGTGSGGPASMTASGALWNTSHPAFQKTAILGTLHMLIPNLALQNSMMNFLNRHSFDNPSHIPYDPIEWRDWFRPQRGHSSAWHNIAQKLDYSERLQEIKVPTLVVGARHDVQVPFVCSY